MTDPVSAQPPAQSILDALSSDHQAITAMLDDATAALDGPDAAAGREQLVMELVRHFVAEEQYLYPTVRELVPEGDAMADGGFAADRRTEQTLRGLEGDLTVDQITSTLGTVRAAFSEHVRVQQDQLFPAMARACDADRLNALGADVRGAEQLAPTRPRAVASASPGVNKVESLVEGFIDHVRDAYSRRGVVDG